MRDRRAELSRSSRFNGIDFVEIANDSQKHLVVHFLNGRSVSDGIVAATITGGDRIPVVPVQEITAEDWRESDGHVLLDLYVAAPGDFSTYTLTLVQRGDTVLDRAYDRAAFSFKARCPSTLDCAPPTEECGSRSSEIPPIDYLAKDYESFRRALFELSALRYPDWQERSEADFGVMFAEALATLADDLSYQQDRIAAEGFLDTATERRSLVSLARLVDYEPRPAIAARTVLRLEMARTSLIPAGIGVSGLAPDGSLVEFETGEGLADAKHYVACQEWNSLAPWWFDDAQRRLPCGATSIWVEDPGLPPDMDAVAEHHPLTNQLLLIETDGATTADVPVRQLVRVVAVQSERDELYDRALLRIVWRDDDALLTARDLTRTRVAANLVPATQGRRVQGAERFVIDDSWSPLSAPDRAIVRTGANGFPQFLYTLGEAPLAWIAGDDADRAPRPEISVAETSSGNPREWTYVQRLLGAFADEVFTIDPMRYRALDRLRRFHDYDGDDGETIRFGDGWHGVLPQAGMAFEVTYRVGGGQRGNVATGTLNRMDPAVRVEHGIVSATNPMPAAGGRDAESAAQVRQNAPQKFRTKLLRAVRPDDYEDAAESLEWVQQAGTQLRYTGSWLSVFTTVDPRGAQTLADERAVELTHLLDRRRLAGHESFVLAPRFAALDIEITVCAQPGAFRADVEQAVRVALRGDRGFFHPDRFTFGQPLERSALEAAIQAAVGVDGVIAVSYRRRGYTGVYVAMPDVVAAARDEIIRVDNDPNRPEHGSLHVDVRGGR